MSEWKEYKLGDAPLQIIDGDRGKNYPSQEEFTAKGDCLFLSTKNVRFHGFDFADCQFISKERDELLRKGKLERNDIVLTTRGTIGNIGFYSNNVEFNKIRINSGMVIIRPDTEKLLPIFNYYIFRFLQKDFLTFTTGTAQPQLPIRDLSQIEIKVPELPEQKKIASVLSSLDGKIDLLHRQNTTLEQLAETLFRQWFIEEAEDSWEEKKVKDVCIVITKGTTPTTMGKEFKEIGINFIKAESLTDVGGFIPEKFAFIDEETNQLLNRSRIQFGDILISIAGTIGRIAYVTNEILPANTNQAIGIMRANRKLISPYFLYCLFKTSQVKNDFEGRIVHAVQPNLSLGEIGDIDFKMPPDEKLNKGMEKLGQLFAKKESNTNQIRTLTRLCDILLPKLMSGEVRVA